MPFLNEIMSIPISQGIVSLGQTLFLNSRAIIPPSNDVIVTAIEYGGQGALRVHQGIPVARPSAQIVARHNSYPMARAKLKEIFDSLGGDDGLHNILIQGVFYLSIVPRQSFIDLGPEEGKTGSRVAFNLDVAKQPS